MSSWLNPLSWWSAPQPEPVQEQKPQEQNQGSYLSWLNPLNWIYTVQPAGVGEEPKKEDPHPQIIVSPDNDENKNIENIPVPEIPNTNLSDNVFEKLPASQSPNLLNVSLNFQNNLCLLIR